MWLTVKTLWQCYFAARHVFQFWKSVRDFPEELVNRIKCSIEHNYHNIHPEQILLAAAVDEEEDVRRWAVEKIEWARSYPTNGIRQYTKPKIIWQAESYCEFVQLDDPKECNPPLLRKFDDLKICITDPDSVRQQIQYACHSQKNEYYVQQVHNVVPICNNVDQVMGAVRLAEESREKNPQLLSKQDFLN